METTGSLEIDKFDSLMRQMAFELEQLHEMHTNEQVDSQLYDEEMSNHAKAVLDHMYQGLTEYQSEYYLGFDIETLARALRYDGGLLAVKINELIYQELSGPVPVDAITRFDKLKALTKISESTPNLIRIDSGDADRVAKARDAVVGRAVLTAINFNVDPRRLGLETNL